MFALSMVSWKQRCNTDLLDLVRNLAKSTFNILEKKGLGTCRSACQMVWNPRSLEELVSSFELWQGLMF